MNRKYIVIFLLIIMFGVQGQLHLALAETTSTPAAEEAETDESSEKTIRDRVEERKSALMDTRENVKNRITERKEEVKEKVTDKQEEIRNRVEEQKEKIATKQAERREKLAENIQERIKNLFLKMTRRMEAAVGRLDHIMNRMQTRMDKLEEKGIDTTEWETDLGVARTLLNDALANIEAAQQELDTVLESDDPRAGFEIIKSTLQDARRQLQEVRDMLREILRDMKAAAELRQPKETDDSEATSSSDNE